MNRDDYDHYVESVSEQLMLIFWVALSTCIVVGVMLAIAL